MSYIILRQLLRDVKNIDSEYFSRSAGDCHLFIESRASHFMKSFFVNRLKVVDVAELEQNSSGCLCQRKGPSVIS